jgi:hypothetical protein
MTEKVLRRMGPGPSPFKRTEPAAMRMPDTVSLNRAAVEDDTIEVLTESDLIVELRKSLAEYVPET